MMMIKNFNKILLLLFLINCFINVSYCGVTSITFTNPNPSTTTTTTTTTTTIPSTTTSNLKTSTTNAGFVKPSSSNVQSKKANIIQSVLGTTQLNCPKNRIEIYCSPSDMCSKDSDCKPYGENQKCCYRIGCGKKCFRGIFI
ncbi:hypothetical protein RB653_002116 [Dictyostelium firmibasis]|uniref:WAP domain-containing protein n=1 Tax=Dictyostelium firmibasis TaxID=79012 RepID=A0AAN7TX78_9MYCE